MSLRSIHISASSSGFVVVLLSSILSYWYETIYLFISQLNIEFLTYFVILNKAAMNIQVQIFVWQCLLISVGQIPNSGISGKWIFAFIRKCQMASQTKYNSLHFY